MHDRDQYCLWRDRVHGTNIGTSCIACFASLKAFVSLQISILKPLFVEISSNRGNFILYITNYNSQSLPYKDLYNVSKTSNLKLVYKILRVNNPCIDLAEFDSNVYIVRNMRCIMIQNSKKHD